MSGRRAGRIRSAPQQRRMLRRCAAAALGGVAVATVVLGTAGPAAAHNYLVSSTPSAGETLTALPPRFEITTNDVLLDVTGTAAGFGFRVLDAQGRYYGDGCITVEGDSMTIPAALGPAGPYTVQWQIVSADGHTVDGSYGFTWQPPAGFAPSAGSTTPPDCHGRARQSARGASSTPEAAPDRNASVPLADVAWIGGAVLAVAIAVVAALVLVGRRKPPTTAPPSERPPAP